MSRSYVPKRVAITGGYHGTHTMGTICGGVPGDQVGVAPGAYWIAAGSIDRGGGLDETIADAIESFQWSVDPDGNPGTIWDVPAVSSNSWGATVCRHASVSNHPDI